MKDGRRDISVVGGGLPPPHRTRIHGQFDETNEFVGEGFECLNLDHVFHLRTTDSAEGSLRSGVPAEMLDGCAPPVA